MAANPFWEYSLETYGRPGVAGICLQLQDEAGLDVNLLLLCLWSAAAGPGRLAARALEAALSASVAWQEGVVQPLRAARRAAKTAAGASAASAEFRRELAATELAAERVEQDLVYAQVAAMPSAAHESTAALADACANLAAYVRAAGADPAQVGPLLEDLLRACWPQLERDALHAALVASGGAV